MEELRRTINEVADTAERFRESDKPSLYPELQEAAERWATHSLRTYNGEALGKALAVSKSIVDFVDEITPEVN